MSVEQDKPIILKLFFTPSFAAAKVILARWPHRRSATIFSHAAFRAFAAVRRSSRQAAASVRPTAAPFPAWSVLPADRGRHGNACVPHTLSELYPANVRISVTAQPRACARDLRYQPDPFVVAEGLYGEPCFLAYFGNVYFFHLRNAALSFIFLRPPRRRPER